jgi:predicted dehydrogenase
MATSRRPIPALPLRVAMVGAGGVSRLHLPAFLGAPEAVRLVAVCDIYRPAAEAYAASAPDSESVAVFADHRELIARGGFDAAVIGLPHFLHLPVATDFVEAGIPVLVEKPLTCTLDETRRLRDLARQRGVPVVAGQMRRFNREAVWLSRWVRQDPGNFGELRSFDLHSWQNILGWLNRQRAGDPWLLDGAKAGGGVVISLAVHQLDLIRFVTGRNYVEVTAIGRFDPPFVNGAESSAVVLMKLDNGAGGVLHASYTTPRTPYSEAMYLFGSNGTIVQHVDEIGQYHGPFRYASTTGRETTEWAHQYQNLERVPEAEVTDLAENPFVNQLVGFATALVHGETPINSVAENFNTMACIQAVNDSLRCGRTERVATE